MQRIALSMPMSFSPSEIIRCQYVKAFSSSSENGQL